MPKDDPCPPDLQFEGDKYLEFGDYEEVMRSARFCLAPYGHGYGEFYCPWLVGVSTEQCAPGDKHSTATVAKWHETSR